MILLRNLTLFFALFLPGSCATGVATGWFVGPFDPPRLGPARSDHRIRGWPFGGMVRVGGWRRLPRLVISR